MYPIHGEPNDFQRFTPYKIQNLMRSHGELQIELLGGAGTTIATIVNNWINRNFLYKHKFRALIILPALPLFALLNVMAIFLDRLDRTKAFPTNIGFILKIASDPL